MAGRRVILLFNPIAGAGRAARTAEAARQALAARGHDAVPVATRREPPETWLPAALAGCDVAVVVGGDGAVRLASAAVAESGAALWHAPAGTENLFARAFGMDADPSSIVAAVEAGNVTALDLGRVQAGGSGTAADAGLAHPFAIHPFAIMASTGFDAAVVHALAARRRGAISHWTYLPAILGELRRWRAPSITLRVDGDAARELGRGVLIVGNLGEYGFRIDPVRLADGSDGLLDAVFLPAESGLRALAWGPQLLLTRTVLNRELVGVPRFRGRTFTVTTDRASPWQADGDPLAWGETAAGEAIPAVQEVHVDLQPKALRVLRGAG